MPSPTGWAGEDSTRTNRCLTEEHGPVATPVAGPSLGLRSYPNPNTGGNTITTRVAHTA
jgi:hypothetical protein